MLALDTLVGLIAALCTTASYLPQLAKAWRTGSTDDLSLKMPLTLFAGIALWVVYGMLKADMMIVLANAASLLMLTGIGCIKLREMMAAR